VFEIDIFQLGQKLGMAHYAFPAKVQEKLQPGVDDLIARRFLASAERVKVQGYTRMRFVRGKGPIPSQPSAVAPSAAGSPQPNEGCGDYGRTAEAWRREMATAQGVPSERVRLWEQVLALARQRTSEILYQAWLARTLLLSCDAPQATLLLPTTYAQEQVSQHFDGVLQDALGKVLGHALALRYQVNT
jgi:hypothetical protein